MRRRRLAPTFDPLDRLVLPGGGTIPGTLTVDGLGPPPEVQPAPQGGVLDDGGGSEDPGNLTLGRGPVPMEPADPFA